MCACRRLPLALLAIGGAAVTSALAYRYLVRPWHLRWGATDAETTSALPGDDFVEDPQHQDTHAVTIEAPAAEVWPWLVQIGQDKGGFYSYTWLENLVGCRMRNADRILPEHQRLQAGDTVRLHPAAPPIPVGQVDPGRAIVMGQREGRGEPLGGTWSLILEPRGRSVTRLIARSRWTWRPGLLHWIGYYLFLEPAHFIMERKMLLGIKARAERAKRQGMTRRASIDPTA